MLRGGLAAICHGGTRADASDGGDDDLMRAFVARRADLLGYPRAIACTPLNLDELRQAMVAAHPRA
jgi:hypothetical protein